MVSDTDYWVWVRIPEKTWMFVNVYYLRGMGILENSRRAANPLVRSVEGPGHPQGVLPQNWGETDLNRSVTCIRLKATVNDRRHLEFRGP
ncbi:hypothetical protein TNCV_2556261 [Trichonephila clavipes]|nr:hypothetical protein TNCV_2556261 [Trichonephila clavipes]